MNTIRPKRLFLFNKECRNFLKLQGFNDYQHACIFARRLSKTLGRYIGVEKSVESEYYKYIVDFSLLTIY